MKKYLVLIKINGTIEKERTPYIYNIGDTIYMNGMEDLYKCIDIKISDTEIYFYFKQGKKIYNFDWK